MSISVVNCINRNSSGPLALEFTTPESAERQIAARFVALGQHPCAVCRDQARQGQRGPEHVAPGTVRREVGGLVTVVCSEHEGSEL